MHVTNWWSKRKTRTSLLSAGSSSPSRQWPRWLQLTPERALISTLLSMTLFGCSVASMQAAPPISTCHVPPEAVEPTPQPPLDDRLNKDLIGENDKVRAALDSANGDKQRIKTYVADRCTEQPSPPSSP